MKNILNFDKYSLIEKGEYELYTNKKGGKFWGDAGAGILILCKTTGRILLAMRSEFVNEPKTWGIFGGKLDDPNESPLEAATRELVEESGYEGEFEVIPAYIFQNKDFTYHNFLGIVEKEFKPTTDWETEYTQWFDLKEFLSLHNKHFGLKALIKNSLNEIRKYAK